MNKTPKEKVEQFTRLVDSHTKDPALKAKKIKDYKKAVWNSSRRQTNNT